MDIYVNNWYSNQKLNGLDALAAQPHTREKVVATANRCECVYKRTGEPSVTFHEKGAAADKVMPYFFHKNTANQKARRDMAPPTRIELITNP